MNNPFTGKSMQRFQRKEKLSFRGEEFEVIYPYYAEKEGDEGFTTDQEDGIAYYQVQNQYRAKYRIPYPDGMQRVRESYGLSANKMATILGLSVNAYRQYESGEVPSLSNARLIEMAMRPNLFKELVGHSPELTEKEKNKILTRLEDLDDEVHWEILYDHIMGDRKADKTTGNRQPDLEKAMELIGLISQKVKTGKVKMNKLLFYVDFTHYRKHGKSVTGSRYRAVQHGPIHCHYDGLFSEVVNKGFVDIEVKQITDEAMIHEFKSKLDANYTPKHLSSEELETLDEVIKNLGKKKASELIELSHLEKGWNDNQEDHGIISYDYAFEMKGI